MKTRIGSCVVAIALMASERCCAQAAMDIDTLRAAVENNLSSISSISGRFSVTFRPNIAEDPILDPWGPENYEWAEDGASKYIALLNPTPPAPLQTHSFDGEQAYTYLQNAESGMNSLTIGDSLSPDAYWMSFAPNMMIGRRVVMTGRSLTELMSADTTTPIEREAVGERACWKATFSGVESERGEPLNIAVFVDPGRDYLPVRIEVRYESEDPDTAKWFFIHEVKEFHRVPDDIQGSQRWFPKVFVFRQFRSEHSTVLDGVRINAPIPVSKFRPQPPPGTQVRNQKTNRTYVVGGLQAADKIVSRAAAEAKAAISRDTSPNSSAVDATPPPHRGFWWLRTSFWLFGISLGVLLVVYVVRKLH